MAKKSKSAVAIVAEPQVNNTINMNLSHADVIEVAVQARLEQLEPEVERLEVLARTILEDGTKKEAEIVTLAVGKYNSRGLKEFQEMCDKLDLTMRPFVADRYCWIGKSEQIMSPEYMARTSHSNDPEESRNPLHYFKRNSSLQHKRFDIYEGVKYQLRGEREFITLTAPELSVTISEKDRNILKKYVVENLALFANTMNELYKCQKEMFELKYDDKKVKARVVRASLSKTEQGKNILSLLEGATNIKLLG